MAEFVLISHRYRCILAHVPKCAGTSLKRQLDLQFVIEPRWHCTWEDALGVLGEDVMRGYVKFAVVRNPWDRVISAWKMFQQKPWCKQDRDYDLAQFLGVVTDPSINYRSTYVTEEEHARWMRTTENIRAHTLPCLHPYYGLVDRTGRMRMDALIGFGRLAEGLRTLFARIGAPPEPLLKANGTKHEHYSRYYDAATREVVSRYYASDIRAFGFRFQPR